MHKRGKEERKNKKRCYIHLFISNDLFRFIVRPLTCKVNDTCETKSVDKEQNDELGVEQSDNKIGDLPYLHRL